MSEAKDFGRTNFVVFRSGRERLLHIVVIRILLLLRIEQRESIADWLVVLWRIATLSDEQLVNDVQMRRIASTYSAEYF